MNEHLLNHETIHRLINTDKTLDLQKQVHIFWEGTQFAVTSFSLVNRELCSSLLDSGVAELTTIPYEPDQFSPAGNPRFERLRAHDIRMKGVSLRDRSKRPHVWVRHQWPPRQNPPAKALWIIMHPWEYSAVPQFYADTFALAEEIWTPSTFSRSAFVSSGLDAARVHIIPNGVDTDSFSPRGKPLELATTKRFRFLFVGGTIYRKGIDILLESYSSAFTSKDDVCLIIKDLGVQTLYKGQTAQDLIRSFQEREDLPEILYLEDEFNKEQMARLYRACDVFVSSYRGEGFSLPTLEAMACGLPVIVSLGGATDDFVDEEVGWRIDSDKRSVKKVYGHELSQEAFLLEPDKEHLEEILRKAYHSRPEVVRKGIEGALRARQRWTWNHAALSVIRRIDSLCGTSMGVHAEKVLGDGLGDWTSIKKVIEEKRERRG